MARRNSAPNAAPACRRRRRPYRSRPHPYEEAIREWRDLGATFELAMCELDLVRFVGGERPEVRAAAEEARSIFEGLGAPWAQRRLDEAMGVRHPQDA